MFRPSSGWVFILFCLGICAAQTVYSGTLVLDKTIPVPSEQNALLVLPIVSGLDGSILFRKFSRPASPLIKIWPDGKKSVRLSFQNGASELQKATDSAFTMTPSGEILVIATDKDKMFLVRFDSDGAYKSHSRFESQMWIEHIAAIGDGQTFLAVGFEKPEEGKPPSIPFTAIFNANAQLVKTLKFPADYDGGKTQKPKSADKQSPDVPAEKLTIQEEKPGGSEALEKMDRVILGSVRSSGDGKVYLLRHVTPALVYVLDSAGSVERTLKIAPPEPGLQPSEMQVAGGRVALEFDQPGKDNGRVAITITDAGTGELLQTYSVDRGLGAAFASYSLDNRFSFVGAEKNNLAIKLAKIER
jgi:hypothetical protein